MTLSALNGIQTAADVRRSWQERHRADSPSVAIGIANERMLRLDLTTDGPHGLVAGTTGSGKSEMLRSLVLGLAATCPPGDLNFVLVDFKGGGAFDAVCDLPHVVGVITDLDEALVGRALVSLRAELERREQLFRDLGVSSYAQAIESGGCKLARLMIVIDEFAALATDYSELMAAIVDLAARGRSLGMHLLLATQRPHGVVDQKIRANTALRVALRVQDAFDSQDVVGVPDAALIDRGAPGQAIVRIGGDDPISVQMAFTGAPYRQDQFCNVESYSLFGSTETPAAAPTAASGPTDLEFLVQAIMQAAIDEPPIRRLWAPPLPTALDWIDLGTHDLATRSTSAGYALGLRDMPEQQTQTPWRWDPASGALALYGASASCVGKSLVALGAAIASTCPADQAFLYVIDGGDGIVKLLEPLPHTGAYLRFDERDRIQRLLRLFRVELASRRADPMADRPTMTLVIDNLAAVVAVFEDDQAHELIDGLAALARDGASLGLHLAMSARAPREISHRLAQQIPNRLVLALADPNGYLSLSIRTRDVVPLPSMRAMDTRTSHAVQLVEPPEPIGWAEPSADPGQAAPAIGSFPTELLLDDLPAARLVDSGQLAIPLGIESVDLEPAALVLGPREHALIVSAPGRGRSTLACAVVAQLNRLAESLEVVRVAPADSPLAFVSTGRLVDRSESLRRLLEGQADTLVVVDDAHLLNDDISAALADLASSGRNGLRIIGTSTPDAARRIGSWAAVVRQSGTGILLAPNPADGDLFKSRLPALSAVSIVAGRGYLINRGRVSGAQFGRPSTPR